MNRLNEREYQKIAIDKAWKDLQKKRSTRVELPTGSGKTLVIVRLAERWKKRGERVLVVCPRRDLVEQAERATGENTKLKCGVEMAERRARKTDEIVCGTVQTIAARLKKYPPKHFGLIVFDEADLALAPTYRKIVAYFSKAKLFGCTATPERNDGQSITDLFESIAHRETLEDMIEGGYLVPIRRRRIDVIKVDKEVLEDDVLNVRMRKGDFDPAWLDKIFSQEKHLHEVVKPMLELAGQRSTLVFGVTVRHAELLAELFNRYRPGSARALSGSASQEERAETYAAFARGEFQFLCNCVLIIRGVDLPFVSCIGMARPTMSRTLYMQMVGRGTRLADGKIDLLVVDFTYNSETHSLQGEELPKVKHRNEARSLTMADILSGGDEETATRADEILASDEGDVLAAVKQARQELRTDESIRKRIRAIVEYRARPVKSIEVTEEEWRTLNNMQIAKIKGVSASTIQERRPARIPSPSPSRAPKNIDVTEEEWKTLTNIQIAKIKEVSHEKVRKMRPVEFLSPAYKSKRLAITEEEWQTLNDREIAKLKNISNSTISKMRPAEIPSPWHKSTRLTITEEEWRTLSDRRIADLKGVGYAVISKIRPAEVPSPARRKKRPTITEEEWRTLKDWEIAKIKGVSKTTIRRMRPAEIPSSAYRKRLTISEEEWQNLNDCEIAKIKGVSFTTIAKRRPPHIPSPGRRY